MPDFHLCAAPRANAVRCHNWKKQPAGAARFGTITLLAMLLGSFALGQGTHAQSPPGDEPAGMDQAIALLTQARLQFQNVRDYECRSINRERVNGTLLPESVMVMRVRSKPFSLYLRCESPDADKGMEVCYVESRNQGKMRVHPAGIQGVLGFWSVDLHDPRAFEKNRHCITEAGLGNLLESTARYWEMERRLNKTLVRLADEEICGRACTRIETIHPDRNAGCFYGYRCVLWLDKATHLPVGAETYDWPHRGGPEGGDLLESYRFLDLRCNIGFSDDTFSR
jgi:hypothetical protein